MNSAVNHAPPLRIFRAFQAKYYDDDVLTGPDAYTDAYFAQLTGNGFNAVWLRGILRDLAATSIFPELGQRIAQHQDALGTVIARAKQYDVKVLLYLNEPLCLPADHPFWGDHPEVRGASGDSSMDEWHTTFAFCTSTPAVRSWLYEVTGNLFNDLPDLGGWFLISASEHHTHCYSHIWDVPGGQRPDCPRCAARPATDVIADLIADLASGTHAASPSARVFAWNWGWYQYEKDPQPELLAKLPGDVTLLLDWERGGHRDLPSGKSVFVDEYSLSYVGPSERFLSTRMESQRHNLPVAAKLQIGTTHELATVPNLPLIDRVYEKLRRSEHLGVTDLLCTWNFGNAFSLNTAAVARFARETQRPEPPVFVAALAGEYFSLPEGGRMAKAIACLSEAMDNFPFDLPLLYFGPANYALAYPLMLEPLTGTPMGRSWMMDERGDDLSQSLRQFSLDEVIACFGRLVAEWNRGTDLFAAACAGSASSHAIEELGVTRVAGCCFRSTRNVYATYRLRRDRPDDMLEQFRPILEDEIDNLLIALPLVEADTRLGFHAECQVSQFSAETIRKKLHSLRY